MGPAGGQKHGPGDREYNEPEAYKRPREEPFAAASSADVEAYRRQHEVSALVCGSTLILFVFGCISLYIPVSFAFVAILIFVLCWQGENVPAPFMSFEAAGFSPDLLREVRSSSTQGFALLD